MHKQNIAHLDLKLNNIVLKDNEVGNDGLQVVKVIDFGLSEHIKDPKQQFLEIHGSLHYFPPEIFRDEGRIGEQVFKVFLELNPLFESERSTLMSSFNP